MVPTTTTTEVEFERNSNLEESGVRKPILNSLNVSVTSVVDSNARNSQKVPAYVFGFDSEIAQLQTIKNAFDQVANSK